MDTRVLVVDDSRLARRNAVAVLGRLQPDWQCLEAANAAEAMAHSGAHDVAVALIDYNMPGQDGMSLAENIRSAHPHVRIAIVSANIQDSVVARAHGLDMAFVPKPLTDEAIRPFLRGVALHLSRA